MSLFTGLFRKKKTEVPTMPTWETIVEMMFNQELDCYSAEVVAVLYSKDRSMRYVITKEENGLLSYQLEAIKQYDQEDWKYISAHSGALPAMWETYNDIFRKTIFCHLEELEKELKVEPEFKQYFL